MESTTTSEGSHTQPGAPTSDDAAKSDEEKSSYNGDNNNENNNDNNNATQVTNESSSESDKEERKKSAKKAQLDDIDALFGSDSEEEDSDKEEEEGKHKKSKKSGKSKEKDSDEDEAESDQLNLDDVVEGNDEQLSNAMMEEETVEKEYGPPHYIEDYSLPKPDSTAKLFWVRLPNILSIEARPFNADSYQLVKDIVLEEEEGVPTKTKVHNPETVIRWRYGSDGQRETNARFVRWSDNSLSLFVGREVYDVVQQNIAKENNHLFVRQKQFIKCHGELDAKMSFRPSSLSSKSHQELTNAIVKKHKTASKIKLTPTTIDPEKQKASIEQAVEQRKSSRDQLAKARKKVTGDKQLSTEFLEEGYSDEERRSSDEEDVNGSISAIKSKYGKKTPPSKKQQRKRSRADDSEEEEAERRILKAKASSDKSSKRKSSHRDSSSSSDEA